MAHYLVKARPRKDRLQELKRWLHCGEIAQMHPFGQTLQHSLEEARLNPEGYAAWEEEDYCHPPLAQEWAAVLDRYFTAISVTPLEEGEASSVGYKHSCLLYVGTEDGMFVFRSSKKKLEPIGRGLERNAVRGIAIHPKDSKIAYVACGLRGWGLYRTKDAGHSWETLGFQDRWVWDVVFHPREPKTLFVGTEPAMLYVSYDHGQTFQAFEGIEKLPSRKTWKFFHEPFYAGHIHGIALHPARSERIFAGVEHGALIYSHDHGKTWHEALVGHDLHRIAIDPTNPDRIFAGTGEGLFVSDDAGRTWQAVSTLKEKYAHGICFDPHNAKRIYIYVAEGGGPLYHSNDGGRTWISLGQGLPENGPADSFSVHPADSGVLFYGGEVGARRGQLFVSFDGGTNWQPLGQELPKIWRLRVGSP